MDIKILSASGLTQKRPVRYRHRRKIKVNISLHKHEHLESLISEEDPLSSEAAFAQTKKMESSGNSE